MVEDGRAGRGGRRAGAWPRRAVLLAGAGLLAVLPAVNLLLMVPAVKSRIERRLVAVAGSDVEVGSISYWPWSGFVLKGVAVAEGGRLPGVVEVDEVRIDAVLSSLLSRDIAVPRIQVIRPRIAIEWKKVDPVVVAAVQQRAVVEAPVAPVSAPATSGAPREVGATGEVPGGDVAENAVVQQAPAATAGRQVVLGVVEVEGGEVSLRLPGVGATVMEARGIGLTCDFSAEPRSGVDRAERGSLEVAELVFGETVELSGLSGEVFVDGGIVRVGEIGVPFGGGRLTAEIGVAPWSGGLPFEFEFGAEGVELGDIGAEVVDGFALGGVLDGEGAIKGYGTVAASWVGEGEFRVAELSVDGGGTGVVLKPAEVSGTLRGGWVNLDRFYAHSDELALRASGGAVVDGRLGVNLRVYVDKAVAVAVNQKLEVLGEGRPGGMRELTGTHYAYRDVAVRGTVLDPLLLPWGEERALGPSEFFKCFTPEGVPVEPFVAQ